MTTTAIEGAHDGKDHHPLAYCEFCGVAVATPLTACDHPLCQEQARELYAPFRQGGSR